MGNVSYSCPLCERREGLSHGWQIVTACHSSRTGLGRTIHGLIRHRVWMTGRRFAREFNRSWGDLARYNGERARGVVHTPEMDAVMAEKQRLYDDQGDTP